MVQNWELDPIHQVWESVSYDYSTSFTIVDAAARQAGEYYLLGDAGGAKTVIEKWSVSRVAGGYYFDRSRSNTPIGEGVAGWPATDSGITGGTYVPLASRQRAPAMRRSELWHSEELYPSYGIGCDPEGRFLLILSGDNPRRLFRLELDGASSPVEIATSTTTPHLSVCDRIQPLHHAFHGRVYLLSGGDGPASVALRRTLLVDGDNDGNFDPPVTLTPEQYAQESTGTVWMTDFLSF
jgi:hypothetical protein